MDNEEKAFTLLAEACELLGWEISFEEGKDQVDGMLIGKKEYIEHVLTLLED